MALFVFRNGLQQSMDIIRWYRSDMLKENQGFKSKFSRYNAVTGQRIFTISPIRMEMEKIPAFSE